MRRKRSELFFVVMFCLKINIVACCRCLSVCPSVCFVFLPGFRTEWILPFCQNAFFLTSHLIPLLSVFGLRFIFVLYCLFFSIKFRRLRIKMRISSLGKSTKLCYIIYYPKNTIEEKNEKSLHIVSFKISEFNIFCFCEGNNRRFYIKIK